MASKTVIGLSGKKQAGKSSIANYLVTYCAFWDYTWAQPIKETIGRQLFGLTSAQLYGTSQDKEEVVPSWGMSPRIIWQLVGDMFREQVDEEFWIKVGNAEIKDRIRDWNVVVSDCRSPSEAEAIKKFGGIMVRVERPDLMPIPQSLMLVDEHMTETALDDYPHDYVVSAVTGQIDDLYDQMDEILKEVGHAI